MLRKQNKKTPQKTKQTNKKHIKRLSFIIQFKIEILVPFNGLEKCLEKCLIDQKKIEAPWSVKRLGVHYEMNFNLRITKICRCEANQLNFDGKKILINSYIHSNFNYWPPI